MTANDGKEVLPSLLSFHHASFLTPLRLFSFLLPSLFVFIEVRYRKKSSAYSEYIIMPVSYNYEIPSHSHEIPFLFLFINYFWVVEMGFHKFLLPSFPFLFSSFMHPFYISSFDDFINTPFLAIYSLFYFSICSLLPSFHPLSSFLGLSCRPWNTLKIQWKAFRRFNDVGGEWCLLRNLPLVFSWVGIGWEETAKAITSFFILLPAFVKFLHPFIQIWQLSVDLYAAISDKL